MRTHSENRKSVALAQTPATPARHTITVVERQSYVRRVETVLEVKRPRRGLLCAAPPEIVHTVLRPEEFCTHGFAVDSAIEAHRKFLPAQKFLGVNVYRRTAYVTARTSRENLVDADILNDVAAEKLQRNVFILRIFARQIESVQIGRIVPVAESAHENILDTLLLRNTRHLCHRTTCVTQSLARHLHRPHRLHRRHSLALLAEDHILALVVDLRGDHDILNRNAFRFQGNLDNVFLAAPYGNVLPKNLIAKIGRNYRNIAGCDIRYCEFARGIRIGSQRRPLHNNRRSDDGFARCCVGHDSANGTSLLSESGERHQ